MQLLMALLLPASGFVVPGCIDPKFVANFAVPARQAGAAMSITPAVYGGTLTGVIYWSTRPAGRIVLGAAAAYAAYAKLFARIDSIDRLADTCQEEHTIDACVWSEKVTLMSWWAKMTDKDLTKALEA